MQQSTIAIIGANLAGGRAAETLRREGFDGRVLMIGEEPYPPYERPPLSKKLLYDPQPTLNNLYLRDSEYYRTNEIEVCVSSKVVDLDLRRRSVILQCGEELPADKILLCTGGRARRLAVDGAELDGVHYMRTLQDALALQSRLSAGTQVVVLGMGVIGAEVAASMRQLGCEVTAVEPMIAPMMRILGSHYGGWLARVHERNGVRVLLERRVRRLLGANGQIRAVALDDGSKVPADVIVIGVGMEPATELAKAAGIRVNNGVIVDRQCRTSSSMVWAAGDVARQPDFFDPRCQVRMETYQNAQEQGTAAAASLLGKPVDYLRPTWFWTDQYDLNIQLCGRVDDRVVRIVRGDEFSDTFSAFYLRDGVIEGVLTVNRGKDMGAGKRLVEQRASPATAVLADESVPLRTLLKSSR